MRRQFYRAMWTGSSTFGQMGMSIDGVAHYCEAVINQLIISLINLIINLVIYPLTFSDLLVRFLKEFPRLTRRCQNNLGERSSAPTLNTCLLLEIKSNPLYCEMFIRFRWYDCLLYINTELLALGGGGGGGNAFLGHIHLENPKMALENMALNSLKWPLNQKY